MQFLSMITQDLSYSVPVHTGHRTGLLNNFFAKIVYDRLSISQLVSSHEDVDNMTLPRNDDKEMM